MTDTPDAELATTGYIKTEWDCPHCGYDNTNEGDCSGERMKCESCEQSVLIERVM